MVKHYALNVGLSILALLSMSMFFIIAYGFLCGPIVHAQHAGHDQGHYEYKEWSSLRTWNCCDDKDCNFLNEDEVRETPVGTEILVKAKDHEPTWCPVKKEHFLTHGKSPDWNKPHACVITSTSYTDPCQAFLCYVPRGGV